MSKILIIAGESSGDLHAAELVKASLEKNAGLQFYELGGEKMREAGAEIIIDNKSLSVIGIFEILRHFKQIHAAFKQIKNILKYSPPDLLILVDYPGKGYFLISGVKLKKFNKLNHKRT